MIQKRITLNATIYDNKKERKLADASHGHNGAASKRCDVTYNVSQHDYFHRYAHGSGTSTQLPLSLYLFFASSLLFPLIRIFKKPNPVEERPGQGSGCRKLPV